MASTTFDLTTSATSATAAHAQHVLSRQVSAGALKRPPPDSDRDEASDAYDADLHAALFADAGDGGGGHCKKRRKQSRPVRLAQGKSTAAPHESGEGVEGAEGSDDADDDDDADTGDAPGTLYGPDAPLNLSAFARAGAASPGEWLRAASHAHYSSPAVDEDDANDADDEAAAAYASLSQFLLPLPPAAPGRPLPPRIFNPDAYCALCNKEFCNKYFLKTHKANKHGIYVENSAVALRTSPQAGSPIAGGVVPRALSAPAFLKMTVPTVRIPDAGVAGKMGGNGTMRAFCDICHKKFCNKYFVRRHKSKIHGITDDGPSPSGECIQKAETDESNGSVDAAPVFPEPGIRDAGPTDANGTDQEITVLLDVCKKDVKSPAPSSEDDVKPEREGEGDGYESDMGRASPSASQQSREAAAFSTDKLRKMGVINADAFCEICCKEYCNKYFLRTHKLKRHGIAIPDGVDPRTPQAGPAGSVNQRQQSSPLNLIVGDQGANSSDSGADDTECDTCGRRFQNAYLLRMHRSLLHFDCALGAHAATAVPPPNAAAPAPDVGAPAGEDLQKLQTMILQLNQLNVDVGKPAQDVPEAPASASTAICPVCQKQVEGGPALLGVHLAEAHRPGPPDQRPLSPHFSLKLEPTTATTATLTPTPTPTPTPTLADSSDRQEVCLGPAPSYVSHAEVKTVRVPPVQGPLPRDVFKSEPEESKDGERSPAPATPAKVLGVASPQGGGPEKRVSATPTSSYCEICNKELCNKYFMKTHMQRMHGIEIENGAQIGGVVCDICNKELCSKYFLRVHKQNTHGIVEEGARETFSNLAATGPASASGVSKDDSALKPHDLSDLSNRYFSHFTEVCPLCGRRFRSSKWLKAHLLNDHWHAGIDKWKDQEADEQQNARKQKIVRVPDAPPPASLALKVPGVWESRDTVDGTAQENADQRRAEDSNRVFTNLFGTSGAEAKSYHCSYCSFSTPVLAFLFVHERSHAGPTHVIPEPAKPLQCPVCLQSFLHKEVFQHHVLAHQLSGVFNPFSPAGPYDSSGQSPGRPRSAKEQDAPASASASASSRDAKTGSPLRCPRCSFETSTTSALRAHAAKEHGSGGGGETEASDVGRDVHLREVERRLQEAARKSQVPASYAAPQQGPGRFIMQPFLLEEPEPVVVNARDTNFVPALVFLPVREKLSAPLTVAFTLTPA